MGTYYKYVNHTLREYVDLSDLAGGGDKMNAVLVCGPALAYLLMPGYLGEYHGRWHVRGVLAPMVYREDLPVYVRPNIVQVESDSDDAYYDMKEADADLAPYGYDHYKNITKPLLDEMRVNGWDIFYSREKK